MLKSAVNKFKLILTRVIHVPALLIDLLKFKFTGKQSPNAYSYLLSTFYLLGGSINILAAKILGRKKIEIENQGVLSKFDPKVLEDAMKQLKSQGYVVIEDVLLPEQCEKILGDSLEMEGTTRVMDDGKATHQKMKFVRENPNGVRFEYSSRDIMARASMQELVFDQSLLLFAQKYLGVAPILDLVAMWWHAPYSSTPDKEAAQWFHFDMDHLKWVKFFFYITDVNSESGPHTFVAGSHKPLGIPFKLRNKGYVRLSDEEVASAFESSKFKEFTGKRGTLIVEDTRGLHKGKHCISGDRLLFQLEYTASQYGQEIPIIEIEKSNVSNSWEKVRSKLDYSYQYVHTI